MSIPTSSLVTALEANGEIQLHLRGDLTVCAASELHQAIRELPAASDVVVRFDEVERLDTSTLQVLLALKKERVARGKKLTVEGVSAEVAALVHLSGLSGELALKKS